jgi:hypothetical protein
MVYCCLCDDGLVCTTRLYPAPQAKFNIDLICRGHQVVEDGYKFEARRGVVTVFSAPNYCGTFDNAGACLTVGPDFRCSFHLFPPASKAPLRSGVVS